MEAKKTPKADLNKRVGMFTNLGLAVAVGLTLVAFEWKSYDDSNLKNLGTVDDNFEELLDVPITQQPPPPPPPPPMEQPVIEEIPDEVKIEEKIDVNFDVDVKETTVIKEVVISEAVVKEEKADEIFDVVETQPSPPGGMSAWNKYLSDNLKYPTQARRMGVEGTVIVVFVVNTDGSIQDVEVLRGIGGGCDEEAVKVVKNAPKWDPGKQRGRAVSLGSYGIDLSPNLLGNKTKFFSLKEFIFHGRYKIIQMRLQSHQLFRDIYLFTIVDKFLFEAIGIKGVFLHPLGKIPINSLLYFFFASRVFCFYALQSLSYDPTIFFHLQPQRSSFIRTEPITLLQGLF